MKFSVLTLALFSSTILAAQKPSVELLTSDTKTSIRGLSVVNDNVVWVSGSAGMVGRSTNGGKNWKWVQVKGFEKTEFRDIEAFNASTAVIMGIAEPAYILRTTDGGDSWEVVYENKTKGMFLDAMEFWNEKAGIIIGDPIDGRFFITRTFDGGRSWQDIPFDKRPVADSGEACFAASGTNIRALDRDEAVFITGGLKSRLYKRDEIIPLPIVQGKQTTGANSISVWDSNKRNGGKKMIVVGGDFLADSISEKNCFISHNGGKTWFEPKEPPHGYRSCVEYVSEKDIFTCGLSGVDYSANGGKTFTWISKTGFHVCRIAKQGSAIYLAGNNGKVAKITWK
ncbi:MAG TPA: oxidoreductase [Chitinophagaceae bacterium]|nr:oxidoreductase [Chitinophagales bacterium]HPG11013.1 oxidoreductase [Chitinophagaceae bacterium]